MTFRISEDMLRDLFERCGFPMPGDEMLFVGIRGCVPHDSSGTGFATSHDLTFVGVDYLHLRCTFVQWQRGRGLAVFPGSTVPYLNAVRSGIARGGQGVNQLAPGFYRDGQSYYCGDHKLSDADRRHRAFRNDSMLPVWRTGDDDDFDGDDRFDTNMVPADNIHCAWQQNAAAASFSSNGCQVVVGRPRVLQRGWNTELGPWKRFVENAYGIGQQRFDYALFSGREIMAANSGATGVSVRFGSKGALAEVVQDALLKHGHDLGTAGADGDFGLSSVRALYQFQKRAFGKSGIDLIVGPATAEALGVAWPEKAGVVPDFIPPVDDPGGPRSNPLRGTSIPASSGPIAEKLDDVPKFRSLTRDGFFSDNPFDLSQRRSVRTNNPGALNITAWQRQFAGFAGETQPDHAGNRTTIYYTPEHGIAAWYHLIASRYVYPPRTVTPTAKRTSVTLEELAPKYAGVATVADKAAKFYIAGWKKFGGGIDAKTDLRFDDDGDMLRLARGMFGHELGSASPLTDEQIVQSLKLYRIGKLPIA